MVHGSAWSCGDQLTLVCGPAGIGKSTVLRELERRGRGRLIEDGIVLLGRQRDRWMVVETGTLELLDLTSRIAKMTRTLTRTNISYWQYEDPEKAQRTSPIRSRFLHRLPAVSFSLAVAVARPARRQFTPVCRPLTRLVEAGHPRDAYPSLRILRDGSVRQLTSLADSAPPGLSTTAVSPLGGIVEVRRRLRQALLTAPAGGAS